MPIILFKVHRLCLLRSQIAVLWGQTQTGALSVRNRVLSKLSSSSGKIQVLEPNAETNYIKKPWIIASQPSYLTMPKNTKDTVFSLPIRHNSCKL